MPRQPTQAAIERAHRIRRLSRGAVVKHATDAERQSAARRKAQMERKARELRADDGE